MTKANRLGEFEQLVLLATHRLRGNAYGMTIRREIAERTDRDVSIGAVYTTLERLERKGFLTSRKGEPTPERGGRAKRFFEVTAPGIRTLEQSIEAVNRMREALVGYEV